MKRRKVEIGKVYSVKVGGMMLPVRVDAALARGGYEGMDMHSGKKVKVATSAIRGDGRSPKQWHLTRQKAEQNAAEVAAKVATKVLGVPVGVAPPAEPRHKAGTKSEQKTDAKPKRKASGLDAAAQVLAATGEPLNTAEMVKRMLAKGLWKTSGKTPAATIYAAIIREIATKGKDARFRKTARGKFELVK